MQILRRPICDLDQCGRHRPDYQRVNLDSQNRCVCTCVCTMRVESDGPARPGRGPSRWCTLIINTREAPKMAGRSTACTCEGTGEQFGVYASAFHTRAGDGCHKIDGRFNNGAVRVYLPSPPRRSTPSQFPAS